MKQQLEQALNVLREQIASRPYPRDELVEELELYNRLISNDDAALRNIHRLKDKESVCVVTAQQLGFMGGPAYTILKAIDCIQTAKEKNAIPIFWAATEDEDIASISSTYILDKSGNVEEKRLSLPDVGIPAEDLRITKEQIVEIEQFCESIGYDYQDLTFSVGQSYAQTMLQILIKLFHGTGLVFIEPFLIRRLARQLFVNEIEEAEEIFNTLQDNRNSLLKKEKEVPLEFEKNRTNLFFKDSEHKRFPILREGDQFVINDKKYGKEELVELITSYPTRASCSAALRPIMQCFIFPTLVYIGGPTERLYHKQLENYFQYYNLPMPWVKPRLSLTVIPKTCCKNLEKLKLQPKDLQSVSSEKFSDDREAFNNVKSTLLPFNEPQERSLNWLFLDSQTKESLVQKLLKIIPWDQHQHVYLKLKE